MRLVRCYKLKYHATYHELGPREMEPAWVATSHMLGADCKANHQSNKARSMCSTDQDTFRALPHRSDVHLNTREGNMRVLMFPLLHLGTDSISCIGEGVRMKMCQLEISS